MSNFKQSVLKDFSTHGLLANSIDGFIHREQQAKLAELICDSIDNHSVLIAEAGTGTGKTFAYLLPAIRSNKKVLISTGSKALQDQLFNKDLPIILNALSREKIEQSNVNTTPFKAPVLLKGRSNYLCLERLDQQLHSSNQTEENFQAQLVKVKFWSIKTISGDIAQCEDVPEDSYIWSYLTSTNDNCTGTHCPRYEECFINHARKNALEAEIVIVNHHLFFADIALKASGFGKIIPEMDVFIFDEAHQIPDIASQYYGEQISSKQLYDIANDLEIAYRIALKDVQQLPKSANYLTQIVKQLRLVLGDNIKGNFYLINQHTEIKYLIKKLFDALNFTQDVCTALLGRHEMIDSCYERIEIALKLLHRLTTTQQSGYSYWFEVNRSHFTFACTPLSVAPMMQELVSKKNTSWIFTSATLSVNNTFKFFNQKMGLNFAKTAIFDSPFDYHNQSLLCVPRYLMSSTDPNYAKYLVEKLSPIIELNKGRCFFLCTSHLMLKSLAIEFRKITLNFPLYVQGEMSKTQLLEHFIHSGNALLLGTNSFWEGVDVKGDALSCVIIDKLPFQSPDDPLLKSRIEDAMIKGISAFESIQIPEAIITLKQGVGRLIRDSQDKGVVIICDDRLVTKNYGAQFLKSLPPMARTRDLNKIKAFLITKNTQRDPIK